MAKSVLPKGFRSCNYKQDYATDFLTRFAKEKGIALEDNAQPQARYFGNLGQNGWFLEGIKEGEKDFEVVYLILFMEKGTWAISYDISKSKELGKRIYLKFGKEELVLYKNKTKNGYNFETKEKIYDPLAIY